jgi:hypothetical protein
MNESAAFSSSPQKNWLANPMNERLTFRARLRVRATEDGGRSSPVFEGYRAMWLVPRRGGRASYRDALIELSGPDRIEPGDAGDVQISPLAPEFWSVVAPGMDLVMVEGRRVVGIARITDRLGFSETQAVLGWYRLDGNDACVIWYSPVVDDPHWGLYADAEGNVLSFLTRDQATDFAQGQAITIHVDPDQDPVHDLDMVARWLADPKPEAIDAERFYLAHNLFAAVANSLYRPPDRQEDIPLGVYQKLSWFSSHPTAIPEAAETLGIDLSWTKDEISGLHRLLADGLVLFRQVVVPVASKRQDP